MLLILVPKPLDIFVQSGKILAVRISLLSDIRRPDTRANAAGFFMVRRAGAPLGAPFLMAVRLILCCLATKGLASLVVGEKLTSGGSLMPVTNARPSEIDRVKALIAISEITKIRCDMLLYLTKGFQKDCPVNMLESLQKAPAWVLDDPIVTESSK